MLSAGAGAGAALCAATVRGTLGASCGPSACRTAAQLCSQVPVPFQQPNTLTHLLQPYGVPSHLSLHFMSLLQAYLAGATALDP